MSLHMGAGPKLTIDAGDGRSMVRADIGGGTTMCFIGVRSNLAGNNKDISSTLVNIKYCNGTENTRQHVAATSCTRRQVTQHIRATNRFVCTGEFLWNFCLCNRIFLTQQVAHIQSDLTLCDLWGRQNDVVQPKISTKILSQYTRIAKISCRFDSSPEPVAATSLLLFSDLRQNLGFTLFVSVFQWFC